MRFFPINILILGCGRDARATWRRHLARSLKLMAPPKSVPSLSAHPRFILFTCLLLSATLTLPAPAQALSDPPPTADEMRAFLLKRPEQDLIHWNDPARGDSLSVRILEVGDAEVRVQKTVQGGLIDRRIPRAELSGISFARTSLEQSLIHRPTAAATGALRVLWDTRSATLGMETSNVADIAIALAKALRMTHETAGFDEAGKFLALVLENNPTDARRAAVEMELKTLELARAVATGPPEETDRIAWEITEDDGNTEAMLMATAWLADRHFEDLKQLEEEHPRWDMDDEVRPLRARLYHLSLDFALYPSLFHGTHEEESADGLRKVWMVHQYTGAPQLALQTLEDLAALYPDSEAAGNTAAELARLKAREAAGNLVEEVAAEKSADETEETGDDEKQPGLPPSPPKPARYNLFDD